jgi:hypothetical protein
MHYPVEWVVSKRMEEIGFIDSYRNYYTDPKQHPGITWTPASPPIVGNNETQDRIDFIWARGIDRVIQSTLIGEALSQDVSLAVTPFPSDHRAVSSTFLIEPVSTGAHIRAFPSSNSILVCFFGMDKPDLTIHIQSNYDTLVLPIYEIKPPLVRYSLKIYAPAPTTSAFTAEPKNWLTLIMYITQNNYILHLDCLKQYIKQVNPFRYIGIMPLRTDTIGLLFMQIPFIQTQIIINRNNIQTICCIAIPVQNRPVHYYSMSARQVRGGRCLPVSTAFIFCWMMATLR